MVCCPVVAQLMPSRVPINYLQCFTYGVYLTDHRIRFAFSTAASYRQLELSLLSTEVSVSFSVLPLPTEEEEGGKGIILIQGSVGWMRYVKE